MKARKFTRVALLSAVSLFFGATAGYAATQSVSANIRFLTDITITKNFDMNFANVASVTAGTYVLSATTGHVTSPDTGIIEGGTPVVGDLTVKGSANQGINISASTGNTNNGVQITGVTCKYGAAAEADCTGAGQNVAAPGGGSGTDLKMGATLAVDGSQADNTTAAPTTTLTVIYQ